MYKSIIVFFSFMNVVWGCARLVQYNDCVNKKYLVIMGCERMNTSGPGSEYYGCLCKENKSLQDCYSLCPDDAVLQLESQSLTLNIQNLCGLEQQYQSVSESASSSTSKTTTRSSSPSTTTPPPPLTVTVTPLASNSTVTSSSTDTPTMTMMAPTSSSAVNTIHVLSISWVAVWLGICVMYFAM